MPLFIVNWSLMFDWINQVTKILKFSTKMDSAFKTLPSLETRLIPLDFWGKFNSRITFVSLVLLSPKKFFLLSLIVQSISVWFDHFIYLFSQRINGNSSTDTVTIEYTEVSIITNLQYEKFGVQQNITNFQ